MSDSLNVRAAKALGWYVSSTINTPDVWMSNGSSLNNHYKFIDDPYTELKFTISLDWSRLIIRECLKHNYCVDIRRAPKSMHGEIEIHGFFISIYSPYEPLNEKVVLYDQGDETEAQMICRACVPFLEELKKELAGI